MANYCIMIIAALWFGTVDRSVSSLFNYCILWKHNVCYMQLKQHIAILHTTSKDPIILLSNHVDMSLFYRLSANVCISVFVCVRSQFRSASKTVLLTAGLINPVYSLWPAIHPSQTPYLIVWKPRLYPANCRLIQGSVQEQRARK